MNSGGLWDRSKLRDGLGEPADVFARETIVARLESLVQEGHGDESLHHLRGAEPPTLTTLRRAHWPVIGEDEAVQLREDMVRYLTYGLWQAQEDILAQVLGLLTGRDDAAVMVSHLGTTGELQEIVSAVEDKDGFVETYGGNVRQALRRAGMPDDDEALARELDRSEKLFRPLLGLIRGAATAELAVIVYHDEPRLGDGLTHHLAATMRDEEKWVPASGPMASGSYDDVVYSNGYGEPSGED
jgi:hypothetical protein